MTDNRQLTTHSTHQQLTNQPQLTTHSDQRSDHTQPILMNDLFPSESDLSIAQKILHLLTHYPRISPSMMQIGIGSSLPANIWRPVLNKLLEKRIIMQDLIVDMSSTGRQQTHTILYKAQPTTTV